MITAELLTDYRCAGGTVVGALTVVGGTFSERLDNADDVSLQVLHDSRVPVTPRSVVSLTSDAGTVWEYRVQKVALTLDKRLRSLACLSPLADLGAYGKVRTISGGVTSFDVGGILSPSDFVSSVILTNLTADGLSWLAAGTITPTATQQLTAPATGWTRLEWLKALADITGAELRLRRNGTTSYLIDLTTVGASAASVPIASGKNLIALQQEQDDADQATAITAFGATVDGRPATIGENLWTLGTIPGSAPYWIPLTDPAGGVGPVAFASQFGTASTSQAAYLLRSDAGTTQITDARLNGSVSEVLVAATTGLTAGQRVQIVADSSATRLTELRTPNTMRLHRTDVADTLKGLGNLAINGTFASWSSDTAAASWTGTVAKYARTTPTSLTLTITANAANLTAVAVSGPANALICKGDIFTASGGPTGTVFVTATVRLDGSGVGTVALSDITGSTAYAATSGATLTLSTQSNRPASFPIDGLSTEALRIARTAAAIDTVLSTAWKVKYLTGLPYICAAVGWTHAVGVNGPITATSLGLLEIRNTVAGTTLASVQPATDLSASSTRHDIVQTSALLSADTTVAVRLSAPSSMYPSALARWGVLWLSHTAAPTIPTPFDGSGANAIWQRVNRALVARQLSVSNLTVTLEDLSAAAGYSVTREQLTLGAYAPLEDLGITSRIIGLTYDAVTGKVVGVVLDSRPQRLVDYLAERV